MKYANNRPQSTFRSLGLIQPLLKAIPYKTPTAIQARGIPYMLEGRDLLGLASTGTGKTAAFLFPIFQHLLLKQYPRKPKCPCSLIVAPTRELAQQIHLSAGKYGQFIDNLSWDVIIGGVSQHPQVYSLKKGIHILIATPGRLIDLVGQGHVNLDYVKFFVLDEVDKMLDMGFHRDILKILSYLPHNRQTLLFSATMPGEILSLANDMLTGPVTVETGSKISPAEGITHEVFYVSKPDKRPLLRELLKSPGVSRALVFTRTRYTAFKVEKYLKRAQIKSDAIYSRKTQKERSLAIERFKARRIRVLVATDIVSRGIDIKNITHVINYDLPESPQNYIHRVGRTGRAGERGAALSLCDPAELPLLAGIEKLTGIKIKVCENHPFRIQSATE